MEDWRDREIFVRPDGSYVIMVACGDAIYPHHVPNEGEFKALYTEIKSFVSANPDSTSIDKNMAPEMTQEELVQYFMRKIDERLNAFARLKRDDLLGVPRYDGIVSACSYVSSSNPEWGADAEHCINMRDVTWDVARQILKDVIDGKREIPSWEEIEKELPVLEWPDNRE